jgi:transposase-like protein
MANNDEIMCMSIKTFECKSCKKKYPAEGFHGKNGKVSTYRCRECRTNYYYMNKYGIAKVQFDDMQLKQDGKCKVTITTTVAQLSSLHGLCELLLRRRQLQNDDAFSMLLWLSIDVTV